MCEECWEDYGSPKKVSPEILEAAELVKEIYWTEPTGGCLHVELDDWNIEDNFWTPWEDSREYLNDPKAWGICVELAALAKKMTIEERASFLAIERGYFDPKVIV